MFPFEVWNVTPLAERSNAAESAGSAGRAIKTIPKRITSFLKLKDDIRSAPYFLARGV
jgi:hypothetical protein